MCTAQRGAGSPFPGDLFLDPDVPDAERVTVVRDGRSAQASHVWTGTGWSRLGAGPVALVPSARPLPVSRTAPAATLTLLQGGARDTDEHTARAGRDEEQPIAV